jgi:hypothetical protein
MLNDDVADELASLEELGSAELRRCWRELTGEPAPQVSPRLLRLALSYELQAREHGGLGRRAQQVLDQVAGGKTRTRAAQPGMRLVREWNGTLHVVTIAADTTVQWNGKVWNSLSEVARAITGTRWSGPAFFGLKQKKTAA